jgi:hypothetical protein
MHGSDISQNDVRSFRIDLSPQVLNDLQQRLQTFALDLQGNS